MRMTVAQNRLFLGALPTARAAVSEAEARNWGLLRYFSVFRLVFGLAAVAYALSGVKVPPFGESNPMLFLAASIAYWCILLASLESQRRRWPDLETHVAFFTFLDIATITVLMHASNGLESGLGLLPIISVAGAALTLGTRLTLFFAALATIAIGIEHNWGLLTGGDWRTDGYNQIGILGIGLFGTALLTHALARRLRATEQLAERRGVDLANLAQINSMIIERMQSGTLVCDRSGKVHMMNRRAREFFGLPARSDTLPLLNELAPEIAHQFGHWIARPTHDSGRRFVNTRAGFNLLPRFALIGAGVDSGALIFLEDTAVLRREAQQLKMTALARLTASIAHEIRNPLGAIVHASQLLSESPHQTTDDKRLLRIIDDQGKRMNTVVENVLQLSRRDHVSPERLRLNDWLADFATQFTEATGNPPEMIAVQLSGDLSACVDAEQFHQIISNLCTNAIKNSPPFDGKAVLALRAGHDHQNLPFVECLDWGSGVSPDIVDRIFDPFFTSSSKGTGLGLYIARELCEANGARIDYHPNQPVGARFRVTLARPEDCVG